MGEPEPPNPFNDLALDDDRYVIFKQTNVPLRDGHFAIHKSGNVEFLAKQLQFKTQKKFLLTDFQFGLSAKYVPSAEEDGELLEAARAKDKVAEQKEREERERDLAKQQEASHLAEHADEVASKRRRKGVKTKLNDLDDPDDDKIHTHPLMEDCLLGIETSIAKILVRLRDHFNDRNGNVQERERCYLTLCHSKLETGIKVANFNLNVEDPARIADFVTTRLSTFINSGSYLHLDLPLDESFEVRFVIVGEQNIKFRKSKGRYEPLRLCENDFVTGKADDTAPMTKKRRSNAIIETPTGYAGNEEAFKNQCLLVSLVLGNWLNKLKEQVPGKLNAHYKQVNYFFKRQGYLEMCRSFGDAVDGEIDRLCTMVQVDRRTPMAMSICDKMAKIYDVQVVCMSDATPPKLLGLFPQDPDLTKPSIFLYLTRTGLSTHVQLISSIATFYHTRGFCCIGCPHSSRAYVNYRHFCKSNTTPSCKTCRRFLMTKSTYVNSLTQSLFCDSQLGKPFQQTDCDRCGFPFKSQSCRNAHTRRFCKLQGHKCAKCNVFLSSVGHNPAHICMSNTEMCYNCFEQKPTGGEDSHLCRWKTPATYKQLLNLGFVHLSYTSAPSGECPNCTLSSCKDHPFGPNRELSPIMASLLFENTIHGTFSRKQFFHPIFNMAVQSSNDSLEFKYLPAGLGLNETLCFDKKMFHFKKPKRQDFNFMEGLTQLNVREGKSAVEQLLSEVICEKYQNFTFITTERNAMDFLVRALIDNNIRPLVVVKGSQTVILNIPALSIRFVCLNQFLSGSPSELRDTFAIDKNLLYLPEFDVTSGYKDAEIPFPQFEHFVNILDTEETILKKRDFWTEKRGEPFHFLRSLVAVNERELEIYATAGLHFVKSSMDFQAQCLVSFSRPAHMKSDSVPVVSAFTFNSTSHFLKATFRTFALPEKTLFTVRGEYGKKKSISKLEHEAVEYLRHKQPNQWVTSYSSSKGQKKFYLPGRKREFMIADAFNPLAKMVFLFCGCYHHGHPNCHLDITKKAAYVEKFQKLVEQRELLLRYCADEVSHVAILWECHYNQLKRPRLDKSFIFAGETFISPFEELKGSNRELVDFLSGPLFRPFEGMVIREALRPALCEPYALKYVKEEGDGSTCHLLDIASLFPFAAINFPLPCGKYYELVGEDISNVDFDANCTTMQHAGKDVIAIVHCRVYPPSNLVHPFLQTKINDLTVSTLCRSCSEKPSLLQPQPGEDRMLCSHSKFERSFVGNYTSQELAYGKSLGYRYDFFEMAIYPESGHFLAKFLTLLGFYKLRHCEWPNDICENKRAAYCRDLSERMRFKELLGFDLTPEMVSPNKKMREVYKSFLNHFLGSFGVNQEKFVEVQYLDTYQQLLAHMKNDRVIDLEPMSDSILRVTLSMANMQPSRSSNVSVSCSVTSIARVIVHQHLQKLVQLNATILRVSCDSIAFVMKDTETIPFTISEAFGCFKRVYPEVVGVVQVGLQLVSVLFRDQDGQLKEKVMASGATMSAQNSSILNHKVFSKVADQLISTATDFSKLTVTSVRKQRSKGTAAAIHRSQRLLFSRNFLCRRQLLKDTPNFLTLPFGYL